MSPDAWATLAAAFLGSGLGGTLAYLAGRRAARRTKAAPRPICACKHGYGHHGPDGCAGKDRIYLNGRAHLEPCGCRDYTGPRPLDSYYAPDILE